LDRALILLDFALYLTSTSVSSVFEVLFMYLKTNFLSHSLLYMFSEVSLVGLILDVVD